MLARRIWMAAGILISVLKTVCVLLGCQRASLPAPLGTVPERTTPTTTRRPPPSATPETTTATPPRSDQRLSTPTASAEAGFGTERAPEDFSIVFHTNIIVSHYRILHLSSSGQAEFTEYDKRSWIWMHRQGNVGAGRAAEIFHLLEQRGFYQLDEEYDIYPLPTDEPEIVYEDWYYVVKVSAAGRPDAAVLSHQKALPAELKTIVNTLEETISTLPERRVDGSYILAGDYEILRYKRPVRQEPTLRLDEEGLEAYPLLKKALERAFSPVQIETLEGTKLGEILTDKVGAVEVILGEERFVVLLLTPPK